MFLWYTFAQLRNWALLLWQQENSLVHSTPLNGFAFCLCGCGSGGLLWCTLEALEHGLVLVAVGAPFVKPVRRSATWLMLEAVGAFFCSPLHSFAMGLCVWQAVEAFAGTPSQLCNRASWL